MWRKIDVRRLLCHWWQVLDERMITAMDIIIGIIALTIMFAALYAWASHDGLQAGRRTGK
jgi:hypothetical protein